MPKVDESGNMRRIPSLKQLEAFLVIEALRNVTSAAARLHVSQPALSRTLRLMEESLGAPLFKRTTREVELTAAGMALLPVAKRLVGEYNESFVKLGSVLDGQAGRVVVASLPSVAVALVPGALRRLAELAPNVEVKILGVSEQQVVGAVRDGTADFGIVTQPAAANWFRFQRILVDEFVLLCRKDDPLAAMKAVPWDTLSSRPFIALSHTSTVRPVLDRAFLAMGVTVDAQYEVDHLSLVGAMIAARLGVAVVPRLSLALLDCSELTSVALKGHQVERIIGSVTRNDLAASPAASRLHAALLEEVQERSRAKRRPALKRTSAPRPNGR